MSIKKLYNKNFVLLWLGQTVSQVGNTAGGLAMLWWVTTVEKSVVGLGTLAMIRGLVAVISGPFAGALSDRLNKKVIIVVCDFLQFVIYGILGYLAITANLTMLHLYILGGISSLVNSLFGPAVSSTIPLIVDKEKLMKANSLFSSSSTSVRIIGYVAGGFGVSLLGIPMLLIIDSLTYLVSAISELFITVPYKVSDENSISVKQTFKDIRFAYDYIRDNKAILAMLKFAMIGNVVFVPFMLLLPDFIKYTLNLKSEVFGILVSAELVGVLLGSILLSSIDVQKKYPFLLKYSMFFMGVLMIPLAIIPASLWGLNLVLFFVSGFVNVLFNITAITLLQQVTEQEHMGKVFGFLGTLCQGLQPLAQGASGVIAKMIGTKLVFIACSIIASLFGFIFSQTKVVVDWLIGKSNDNIAVSTD